MNKGELIKALQTKAEGCSEAEAERYVNAFIDIIVSALKGGKKVVVTGFGTFEPRHRAARMGVNPQTGEKLQIPAMTVPAFKAGKGLKDALR